MSFGKKSTLAKMNIFYLLIAIVNCSCLPETTHKVSLETIFSETYGNFRFRPENLTVYRKCSTTCQIMISRNLLMKNFSKTEPSK